MKLVPKFVSERILPCRILSRLEAYMFKKGVQSDSSKKSIAKKMNKISYDEHFTRATESIDLAKNQKFTDIDDGISKRQESEVEKYTK